MAITLKVSWIILWTLVYGFREQVDANLIPDGQNVCSRQESFAESYMVSVQHSVNKQVSYKCRSQGQQFWRFYKTCYRNSVIYQVGYKQMYRVAYRTLYTCCNGWQPTGNTCTTPICSQGCYNGTCIKPNVCTCLPGYHGVACNQTCQSNKWGPGCNNTCQCRNNATCDMRNGSCSCLPGWQGRTCDQPCQQGYYGNKCAQACTCLNGAICNHVTGDCNCSAGWQGQQCNVPCSLGHYGNKCQRICKCQNNAKCDHVTGACSCAHGYQGNFCEKLCNSGFYGNRCQEKCRCKHGSCDRVTGACSCAHGYQGIFCEKPCNSGFYGNRCQEKCRCEHGSCDHVSGTCTCRAGYRGPRCAERCPINTYGINCSLSCSCPPNATCDPKDGTCTCKKGFIGESCNDKCQSGHYGNRCQEKCSCYSDESCDPLNGKCTCEHESCSERLKASKDKSSGAKDGPLIPAVVSVIVILIIISIAIACFVYHKRRNQRMRDKPNSDEPGYEFSNASATHTAKKENDEMYQLVTKDSIPMYMELKRTSEMSSKDGVDEKGIQNPAYQKLVQKSRESGFGDVGSVAMETQYANFGDGKKSESVYQPLQRESVMQDKDTEPNSDSRSAYQSLTRPNSDNYHVKYNPGYEPESPSLYENSTSVARDDRNENNNSDNLYLELISDENKPGNSAVSDDQPYEILPPTGHDNRPIYDNL